MRAIVNPNNKILYGDYENGAIDFNFQDYHPIRNGKPVALRKKKHFWCKFIRYHIYSRRLILELEIIKSNHNYRVRISGYDRELEKIISNSWVLSLKAVNWDDNPENYRLKGHGFGLKIAAQKNTEDKTMLFSLRYFERYKISFKTKLSRVKDRPISCLNPFTPDSWIYTEKHSLLEAHDLELKLDGHNISNMTDEVNIAYQWAGGYFPEYTNGLNINFWQSWPGAARLGGALLAMGHDTCSSESAIWMEHTRWRLSRVTPQFNYSIYRVKKLQKLPDLYWEINAGDSLQVKFSPYLNSVDPVIMFPVTNEQKIYGSFSGYLLDKKGQRYNINEAIGFIDYRQIQWWT